MRHTIFTTYHPAVIFSYFVVAIVLAFSSTQPMYVAITLVAACAYYLFLKGWRDLVRSMRFFIPILVVIAFVNAAFVNLGSTPLFNFLWHTYTLEALVYGLCSAGMLVAVLLWFGCYQEVMETDKFLYLFGRIVPVISLMISMVFRLIPDLVERSKTISVAQTALSGSVAATTKEKTSAGIRMASVLMSLSMEDSIETSDSMRARGYGSAAKRTTYARYHWTARDTVTIAILGILAVLNAFLLYVATSQFVFYPVLTVLKPFWWGYLPYLIMLIMPLLLEVRPRI